MVTLTPVSSSYFALTRASELVDQYVRENEIVVFSRSTCPYCREVKNLLTELKKKFKAVDMDEMEDGAAIKAEIIRRTGQKTVPNVVVRGLHIGGCDSTKEAVENGKLDAILNRKLAPQDSLSKASGDPDRQYDYDLVVIGGGSGGNACAKEAAKLGARVCILDFVKPTPMGISWGYGGTCVNVGCIPKKLFHQAALIGEYMKDGESFGWKLDHESIKNDYETLIDNINNHILSLNFNYRGQLRRAKIDYKNSYGEFKSPHVLRCMDKKGEVTEISSEKFVIAVGGRPRYPGIPGAKELGITSDDIFWLKRYPGKTVVIGASYVALECAGFLRELGCDVTVMIRSILLRGFDQEIANLIGAYMENEVGVEFLRTTIPTRIECTQQASASGMNFDGTDKREVSVHYKNLDTDETGCISEVNTVIFAIGRDPVLDGLKLENAGDVLIDPKTKKIVTINEKTSADHVYAIGDCIRDFSMPSNDASGQLGLELTPVAIKAGILLAERLFSKSTKKMNYNAVPTTVFTPLEYGCIGLSEQEAKRRFGEGNIDVYHNNIFPFEWTVPHRSSDVCYIKLIVLKPDDERVVGFHYFGPNAGEVTQGFALGIKLGARKSDFDELVGIHPTSAESFTKLTVTKASGAEIGSGGC
ncbi:hypothetical protein ACOME3_002513 [Neoechinorhynchus agilis]